MRLGDTCETPRGWRLVACSGGGKWWQVLRCRKCSGCWEWWRGRTVARIKEVAAKSEGVYLLTLTSRGRLLADGTYTWPDWAVIMRRFASFCKSARLRWKNFSYAAVKEEGTRYGMRHLHVVIVEGPTTTAPLLNCRRGSGAAVRSIWERLLRRWASKAWCDRTGAWVVDVQKVGSVMGGGRLARYVAKYLAKGDDRFQRKLVSFSSGWHRTAKSLHRLWLEMAGERHTWRSGYPTKLSPKGWSGEAVMVLTPCKVCGRLWDDGGSASPPGVSLLR